MLEESKIVDFCCEKEIYHLHKDSLVKLAVSSLRPQEMHVRLNKNGLEIIRQHENQDRLRVQTFMHQLTNCGADFSEIDFEAIVYFGDDLTFYDQGAPRLCFTRRKNHKNILLPDPHIYNVAKFVDNFKDWDCDFYSKKNKAVFAGSYCGGSKPKENQRFKFCWDNQDKKLGNFKITNFFMDVVPNGHSEYLKEYDWKKIQGDFLAPYKQMEYKYIFNINGETNCWDRFLWAMYSNSLCLYLSPKRNDMSWYYHYLKSFGGFTFIDEIDWEASINWFNNNPEICKDLVEKQKEFSRPFVKLKTHYNYLKQILYKYNDIYNS